MSFLHSERFGQGPDLVLIHGWGMHGGIWQPVIHHLQKHFRLTIVDLPGHGYSPLPAGGFDLDRLSQLLLDSVPAHAIWIGWSLGGMAALNAALNQNEKIEKIVLVSAQPQFIQSEDWPHATPAKSLSIFSDNLLNHTEKTLKRFLSLQIRGSTDERDLLRQVREKIDERPLPQTEALRLGLDILCHSNLRPKLSTLQTPLQLIFGGRDTLVPAACAEPIQAILPQARINIIKGAGHLPFLSHQQEFLSLIENFIDQ